MSTIGKSMKKRLNWENLNASFEFNDYLRWRPRLINQNLSKSKDSSPVFKKRSNINFTKFPNLKCLHNNQKVKSSIFKTQAY